MSVSAHPGPRPGPECPRTLLDTCQDRGPRPQQVTLTTPPPWTLDSRIGWLLLHVLGGGATRRKRDTDRGMGAWRGWLALGGGGASGDSLGTSGRRVCGLFGRFPLACWMAALPSASPALSPPLPSPGFWKKWPSDACLDPGHPWSRRGRGARSGTGVPEPALCCTEPPSCSTRGSQRPSPLRSALRGPGFAPTLPA